MEAEPMVWAIARYMVTALFMAGHDTVILDATNITVSRRDEWISREWTTALHVIPTTRDECVRRALDQDDMYIVPVIDRMAAQIEWPSRAASGAPGDGQ